MICNYGEMVNSCAAVGCTNRVGKKGIIFYRFPADAEQRAKWLAAVRRDKWKPTKNSRVCSEHFVGGRKSDDRNSPGSVPTIFSFTASPVKRKREHDVEVYEQRKKRRINFGKSAAAPAVNVTVASVGPPDGADLPMEVVSDDQLATTDADKDSQDDNQQHPDPDHDAELDTEERSEQQDAAANSPEEQEEITSAERDDDDCSGAGCCAEGDAHVEELSKLKYENGVMRAKIIQLQVEKDQLQSAALTEESFMCDDDKVQLYTGLPSYALLNIVFNFVAPCIRHHHRSTTSKFSQFLMVLMKLRLNLTDADLAYRFGVSRSTVSRIFLKWITVMYARMKPLIIWPEREELKRTMPYEFVQHFKNCVCIIDCFEVFIERPSDLMARAKTYSNYKHHNTVKFLIGISPQGSISFLSKAWGGRTSDKYLTERCGILKKLVPGDQLLADRGFTVRDSVGLFCAELVIPPFTKGKKQLSQVEVDKARQLSRVRIHVERVIGLLRNKYTILQATLPISLVMHKDSDGKKCVIDMIATVCAALCNCCESVVPFS